MYLMRFKTADSLNGMARLYERGVYVSFILKSINRGAAIDPNNKVPLANSRSPPMFSVPPTAG